MSIETAARTGIVIPFLSLPRQQEAPAGLLPARCGAYSATEAGDAAEPFFPPTLLELRQDAVDDAMDMYAAVRGNIIVQKGSLKELTRAEKHALKYWAREVERTTREYLSMFEEPETETLYVPPQSVDGMPVREGEFRHVEPEFPEFDWF